MRPTFPHEYLDFGDFQMLRIGRNVTFGEVRAWFRDAGYNAGFLPKYEREGLDLYFLREAPREAAVAA